ncbi:MAG: transporter substrate-binding domain-containing protein [Motiliproteus sp.]
MRTLIFVAFLLSFTAARASEWTVVVLDNPPYAYLHEGRICGTGVRIARMVMDSLGRDYQIRVVPWARALTMVRSGEAQIGLHASKTSKRSEYAHFTKQPIILERYKFYQRAGDSLLDVNGHARIPGLRLGLQRGYNYPQVMQTVAAEVETVILDDVSQGLNMIHAGRIDLFLGDSRPVEYWLRELGLDEEITPVFDDGRYPSKLLEEFPNFLFLSKNTTDTADLKLVNDYLYRLNLEYVQPPTADLANRIEQNASNAPYENSCGRP